MGPKENNERFYVRNGDEWIPLLNFNIENLEPINLDTEIDQIERVVLSDNYWLPIPKEIRCHSRKRFIKLAMSLGYSKDSAKFLAELFIALHGSYQKAYLQLYLFQIMYEGIEMGRSDNAGLANERSNLGGL